MGIGQTVQFRFHTIDALGDERFVRVNGLGKLILLQRFYEVALIFKGLCLFDVGIGLFVFFPGRLGRLAAPEDEQEQSQPDTYVFEFHGMLTLMDNW